MLIGILYHAMRMLGGRPTRKSAGELMGGLDSLVLLLLLLGSGLISAFIHEIPYLGAIIQKAATIVTGGVM